MAINGRINVDVLFHDTDGTTSLKVVSLEDATEYTTGKVAIVTGTVVAAVPVEISPGSLSYKDAAGSAVTFSSMSRLAFSVAGSQPALCEDANNTQLVSRNGSVAVSDSLNVGNSALTINVIGTAGTAAYTLVIYGT